MLAFLDGLPENDWFRLADVKTALHARLNGNVPSDKRLAVELQRLDCESMGKHRHKGVHGRWWRPPIPF